MATHFPLLAGATLLLLLCLSPTLTTAKDDDLVLDTQGNPVEVDSEYYIYSVRLGFRGGITTSPRPDTLCPLFVVESPFATDSKPVRFIPTDSTQTQIHLSSDLLIEFGFDAYCRDIGLWRLSINAVNGLSQVVANGAFNLPPAYFQIRKKGTLGYVLSQCPAPVTLRGKDQDHCDDLGVFDDNGLRVLGFPVSSADGDLRVFFKKKTDDNLAHRAAH